MYYNDIAEECTLPKEVAEGKEVADDMSKQLHGQRGREAVGSKPKYMVGS